MLISFSGCSSGRKDKVLPLHKTASLFSTVPDGTAAFLKERPHRGFPGCNYPNPYAPQSSCIELALGRGNSGRKVQYSIARYCSRPKKNRRKVPGRLKRCVSISKSLAAPSSWRLGHSSKPGGTAGSVGCSQPSSVLRAEAAGGLCRGSARKTSGAKLKRTVLY